MGYIMYSNQPEEIKFIIQNDTNTKVSYDLFPLTSHYIEIFIKETYSGGKWGSGDLIYVEGVIKVKDGHTKKLLTLLLSMPDLKII